MYFYIDKVTTHQDGSKTAVPIESYKQSNTFINRYRELLNDETYEGVWDEENQEQRNYNFAYEIMDESQSKKLFEAIYLSEHDLNELERKFPLNFEFEL